MVGISWRLQHSRYSCGTMLRSLFLWFTAPSITKLQNTCFFTASKLLRRKQNLSKRIKNQDYWKDSHVKHVKGRICHIMGLDDVKTRRAFRVLLQKRIKHLKNLVARHLLCAQTGMPALWNGSNCITARKKQNSEWDIFALVQPEHEEDMSERTELLYK